MSASIFAIRVAAHPIYPAHVKCPWIIGGFVALEYNAYAGWTFSMAESLTKAEFFASREEAEAAILKRSRLSATFEVVEFVEVEVVGI